MKIVDYERSFEQNEELGLNDMMTGETDAIPPTQSFAEEAQIPKSSPLCGENNAERSGRDQ
jgi:hypothetical protein